MAEEPLGFDEQQQRGEGPLVCPPCGLALGPCPSGCTCVTSAAKPNQTQNPNFEGLFLGIPLDTKYHISWGLGRKQTALDISNRTVRELVMQDLQGSEDVGCC